MPDSITFMELRRQRQMRDTVRMNATRRLPGCTPGLRTSQQGATLLDTCAALALASAAALAVISGARPLSCAIRVGAARTALVGALLEARRAAYASETSVIVETRAGSDEVVVNPPGSARRLGDGVLLTSVPSDGNVQFRATGLADNATVSIACDGSEASVVVNQRGVIR